MVAEAAERFSEMRKPALHIHRWHILALLLLLMTLPNWDPPAVQAQGGCVLVFRIGGSIPNYARFPSSNIITSSYIIYRDSNCQTEYQLIPGETSRISLKGGAMVLASSRTAAERLCRSARNAPLRSVRTLTFNSNVYDCFYGRSGGGNGGRDDGDSFNPAAVTLPLTDLKLDVVDGRDSGAQFRRLNNYGVGDPAVFEMGFLDAVDIWANIGSGYTVCFPQEGRIVFLDAATSPRTLTEIEYVIKDGQTCATMDRAGTMVLVKAPEDSATATPTEAPTPEPTRRPGTDDSVADAIDLQDCMVTPRVNLRLRAAPWGGVLAVVPSGAEVPASARTRSWFKVAYDGVEGWAAAWLADGEGDCDWR